MANNPFDQFDAQPANPLGVTDPNGLKMPTRQDVQAGKTVPLTPAPAPKAANPFDQFDSRPTQPLASPLPATANPPPAPQSTADKYAGWDQPSAPAATTPAQKYVPLKDDPNYEYGEVLPFAQNKKTGVSSWAWPEMIRAPIRGMVEGGQEARGLRPVDDPSARGDISAAAMTLGIKSPNGSGAAAAESKIKPVAVEARTEGYVLPPKSISEKPGIVASTLAGWGGKIKTQQDAATVNQGITNRLAAKSIGAPEGLPLTEEVFSKVRADAGRAYQAVADAVPTIDAAGDKEFQQAIQDLGGHNSHAAQVFPKIVGNKGINDLADELGAAGEYPTGTWMETVKVLRSNANANLKAINDPNAHALGLSQREAANAIDEMMDRQISKAGSPDVIQTYRQARQLIAKSYDLQGATNTATGDVNARGLAKLANAGKPLTGELKTIARVASAFPKAMQVPAGFGDSEAWSALDFFGALGAGMHGNPAVVGAILGRPLARKAVLGAPVQDWVAGTSPFSGSRVPAPLQITPIPYQQQGAQGATNGQ